jgi:hypothetical protein
VGATLRVPQLFKPAGGVLKTDAQGEVADHCGCCFSLREASLSISSFGGELTRACIAGHSQIAFDDGNSQAELRSNFIDACASFPEQPGLGGEGQFHLIASARSAFGRMYVCIQLEILRG